MTEEAWVKCSDLSQLFAHLRQHRLGGRRKRFLLGLALCGRVGLRMPEVGREAVAVAERFSRGEASEAERWAAFDQAGQAYEAAMCEGNPPVEAALYCAYRVVQVAAEVEFPANWDTDTLAHLAFSAPRAISGIGAGWDHAAAAPYVFVIADLLRDIFGNPFRPVAFAASWRTSTAVALAQAIYEERAFDRLPILADALQDAGCEDEQALAHCRGEGVHVRGCWVVDGVLGKG